MSITALVTLFISVELGLFVGLGMSFVMLIHGLGDIQTSLLGESVSR